MAITDNAQDSFFGGVADAMRRAPLVYAVLLEFILIMGFVAWLMMEEHQRQELQEKQEAALQTQLVECLRSKAER